jgi:hypothetical protein
MKGVGRYQSPGLGLVGRGGKCWRERGYRAFQRANPGDMPVRRRKWRAR